VRYLLPRIEAIHAGATRNNTVYLADKLRGHEELKSGVFSWTKPYPKPIIYNHDVETEVTGRVHTAAFTEFTAAGRPGIIVVPKISHPKAIQDILDGRLLTVSIGATTDSAICTICGTDIINEGFCGHYRGEAYDGVTAQWECGNLWFDELSWVNVPADQDAMIVDMGAVMNTTSASRESVTVTSTVKEQDGSNHQNPEERDEKEMEELQKQLEALQAEKDALVAEKAALVAEKEALEAEKASLVAEKAELTTKVEEATAEVEAEKAKVTEKEQALAEKETALVAEQEAREQLVAANTDLAAEIKESKVAHLVDLRLALGEESDKETAITKFKERSIESIKDSISDLAEKTVAPAAVTRVVEKVEHPATQVTQTTPVVETLTAEDIFKKLLLGQR
jgi:DNA repair exonuclease SbcCD ATPase subunit